MRKIFRTLVSVDEARELLTDALRKLVRVVSVDVQDAVGYVLAESVYSIINIPPFMRSMRDGYAVRHIDVAKARESMPVKLKVIGKSSIGEKIDLRVSPGEAVEIDTGAMVPAGADAVVMEEFTERKGDYILVYKPVRPNENIQQIGADAVRGELLVSRGTLITPREVGVLSASGIKSVKVYTGINAGVISTGDEIVRPGDKLGYGMIYDVNGPMITSILRELGIKAEYYGIARDDPYEIMGLIEDALKKCSLVITSGSTSVGTRDQLINIIESLEGSEILFHGVKQKPGRPTLAAVVKDKVLIGLPGFPVSALMVFYNIVYPALMHVYGLSGAGYILKGKLGVDVWGEAGQLDLIPVIVRRREGGYIVYPVKTDSGAIVTLSLSDGYIEIPNGQFYLEAREEVEIHMFSKSIEISDLLVIGSHSIALDRVIAEFKSQFPEISVRRVWVGSSGVFEAIKVGYGDLGGTHLLDEKSGEYNIPFLHKFGVKNAVLYRGFKRQVGIIVAKDNPNNVHSLWDVYKKKLRFINRVKGSGARSLIDMLFRSECKKRNLSFDEVTKSIDGYFIEAKTHDAVVTAVEIGYADVGVAAKSATIGHDVDFIPLTEEYYDILVSKSALNNPAVKKFLDYLFSRDGKEILRKIEGISIPENYGEVIAEV